MPDQVEDDRVTTVEPGPAPGGGAVGRLVLGSALMLFLELALIRWLGSNIVHLSYFSNFVLLGSFLGIGAGFLIARRGWTVLPVTPALLLLLVWVVREHPVVIDRSGAGLIYFTGLHTTGPPPWLALPAIFLMVAAIMAGPAEVVGYCFARMAPLTAYRWDLVGSLLGIGLFTLLSFLRMPPVVWAGLVAVAFVVLSTRHLPRLLVAACGVGTAALLLSESLASGASWSPYYKVVTRTEVSHGTEVLRIAVNGVPHQSMGPAAWRLEYGADQYLTPYLRVPGNSLDRVLVVGAGSGSDVAIALSRGAGHVDAVEIDPRLMQIGIEQNPDRAYQDPRVTRHVNDGRAYLESTDQKYDLVLFALPDSLALVQGASQIRLESYLFTQQAFEAVREHLAPGGAFAMYNYYREDWLIDRLAGTVAGVFGHQPCVDRFTAHQAVIAVTVDEADQRCGAPYQPSGVVVPPAQDDAPFLYFRGGDFPSIYLWTLGGILLITVLFVRALGGPFRRMRPFADLFFMGAAFLLLETKNIATFALLFGTTWFVNALVFAGILVVVLAAVETTRLVRTPSLPVVYAGVLAALALAYVVRPEWLLPLPFLPRLTLAVLLAFLPIFLANIAFAKRFRETGDTQEAFAINIIGAMVGGCLEYVALLTGYRDLLLLVAALYAAAFLLLDRARLPVIARPSFRP